jgi:hypothetical protein
LTDTDSTKSIVKEGSEPGAGLPNNVAVWGIIQTEYGEVSTNDKVKLYSRNVNRGYSADSDINGHFSFDDVVPADDYRMTVDPSGMFKRVVRESVSIESDQTELSIVLQSLPLAVLKGRIIDSDGIAVPEYEFKAQSPKKAQWIVNIATDVVGEFLVEDVPVGALEFTKTFGQALLITGYQFQGDGQPPIELVVDTGPYEVNGVVYDQFNDPVAGATVILSWENTSGTIRSVVNRRDATNPSGHFSIKGLGRGEHDLLITVMGGLMYQQEVNAGVDSTDLTIILSQ